MALAGKDAELRLESFNFSGASQNKVLGVEVISSTLDLERDQAEIPHYGDEGQRRLYLLEDHSFELELAVDSQAPGAGPDGLAEDAMLNEHLVALNYAPDGTNTKVYQLVTQVESVSVEGPADGEQTATISLVCTDDQGNTLLASSVDGGEVLIETSFSIS